MGYYRRFILNFATQAGPLSALLRKDIEFLWTDKCDSAFNSLKSLLTKAPILMYPYFKKQFILQTDASLTAIGAVL